MNPRAISFFATQFLLISISVCCLSSCVLQGKYLHKFHLFQITEDNCKVSAINMEKYCLTWNQFQSNVTKALSDLRKDSDFFDVTLVTEDLHHISAHKMALSASSDLFKTILKKTQSSSPHPLIYLSGVGAKDLNFVLDYIYHGEVELFQNDVHEFLNVAKRLKIEGLIGEGPPPPPPAAEEKRQVVINEVETKKKEANNENKKKKAFRSKVSEAVKEASIENKSKKMKDAAVKMENKMEDVIHVNTEGNIGNEFLVDEFVPVEASAPSDVKTDFMNRSVSIEDALAIVDTYIEDQDADGWWRCKTCGKTSKSRHNIRKHAEIHIEGLSFACQLCGMTYKTRMSLDQHRKLKHTKKDIVAAASSLENAEV